MEYPDLGGRHSESGPVVVVGPRYSCGTNMASSLSGFKKWEEEIKYRVNKQLIHFRAVKLYLNVHFKLMAL